MHLKMIILSKFFVLCIALKHAQYIGGLAKLFYAFPRKISRRVEKKGKVKNKLQTLLIIRAVLTLE